jgi:cyclophilin family peptidyl-prolyl cis-trans isomerase/HEAT repeat protein
LLLLALAPVWPLTPFGPANAFAQPPSTRTNTQTTVRAIAIAEDRRNLSDGTLRRAIRDTDWSIRARAALAVGRIQDSTSVKDVLPLLEDAVPEVRREAIFALGQIGHRSAREALEHRLVDTDGECVILAIEALGKLGDHASTARIARLLHAPAAVQRGEAAIALWRLADSTALEPLLDAHDDSDSEVRWRVIYALEKIVAPDRIVLIAGLHLGDKEWLVRSYAARTLGRQKSPRAMAYLLQTLADPEVPVVVNGLRAIQQIADSTCTACAATIAQGLGHLHPYVRVTAASVLADAAPWAFADTASRRAALDSLRFHLRDSDAATRGACARALLLRLGDSALETVTPVMATDSSLYARVAVLGAVAQAASRSRALGILTARLGTDRPLLERMTAAEGLGTLRDSAATRLLRQGVRDTSILFAAACAGALGEAGGPADVPLLTRAYVDRVADADADARISIRDALRQLGGRAYADSIERAHPVPVPRETEYPKDYGTPPSVRGAILHTTRGDIEWSFYGKEAPQTVANFVRLAERRYFDGLAIHRVVPNFVIQDGDPTGTGSGGPGYTIRCEYNRLRYDPGAVGMALSGKDTGGSQWFITHSPQHHLNGRYTIFARVVHGQDVVGQIVQGDRVLKVDILR